MKERPGKVKAPDSRPWLWRDLFRQKAQEKFVGTDGSKKLLMSEEGQTKITEAKTETTAALGYTLEEAIKEDELDELWRDLQYSKPEPKSEGGELGLMSATEPEDIM